MRRALVVVGKAPVAGASKTRLLEALSAEASAALARAFLLDALEGGLGLRWEQVTLLHPNSAAATVMLETLVPTGVELQPQNGSGLGDALASAFAGHFAAGFERVV